MITSLFSELNWLAILAATILSFIIGAIWFGPKTLYPVWMKAQGREVPTERIKMTGGETLLMFGGTFVATFIQVLTLGFVIAMARTINLNFTIGDGVLLSFLVAVGIGAFASLSHRMFSHPEFKVYKSLKVWLIEVGQDVVCLTLAGLILSAWV